MWNTKSTKMYSYRVRTVFERQHGHLVAVSAFDSLVERRHVDLAPRVLLEITNRVRRHVTGRDRLARVVVSARAATVSLPVLNVKALDESLIAIWHLLG